MQFFLDFTESAWVDLGFFRKYEQNIITEVCQSNSMPSTGSVGAVALSWSLPLRGRARGVVRLEAGERRLSATQSSREYRTTDVSVSRTSSRSSGSPSR